MFLYVCPNTVLFQDWFREYKNRKYGFSVLLVFICRKGCGQLLSLLADFTHTDTVDKTC